MSILLSGIEMPRTCYYCRFQLLKSLSLGDNRLVYFHSCSLLCKNVDDYENNRREDCPLIKIPTPHGRLIDADKIEYHFEVNENTVMEGCEFVTKSEINRMSTVIEREE